MHDPPVIAVQVNSLNSELRAHSASATQGVHQVVGFSSDLDPQSLNAWCNGSAR